MFRSGRYLFCCALAFSLLGVANAQDTGGCARGAPEAAFSGESPNVTAHDFEIVSGYEAVETVVFAEGARLILRNWGCEYFVNTLRYESNDIDGKSLDVSYWFKIDADALKKVAKSNPKIVFDLEAASETLAKAKSPDFEKPHLNHVPIPVEGDGVDFLQTQVVVKDAGMMTEGGKGFVEIELMKGPL